MEILLTVAYTAIFIFLISKLRFFVMDGISKRNLQWVFLLKIISGFLLSLIYTYYYTDRLYADCFKFYDDSKVIYDLFFTDKKIFFQFMLGFPHENNTYMDYSNVMHNWWNRYNLYNENRTIIRLNVVMRFISLGYYQVHNVFFCFLSFAGLVAIAKLFLKDLKEFKKPIFIFVFLFPSLIFWGSGVLKDGLILFCSGMTLYFMDKFCTGTNKKIPHFILSFCFLVLLLFVKVHVFFIFLPCYIAYALSIKNRKHVALKFIAVSVLFFIFLLSVPLFSRNINFLQYLAVKQKEFINLAEIVKAGSAIYIQPLEPTIWSLIKNSPVAFYNTMFRPNLLDSHSPFILLSALENIFIICFGIIALLSITKKKIKISPMFYFSVIYVVALFVLVGLITPVMGAIVRYKIQGLPFLFFIFLALMDKEKLLKRFPFLKPLID
ncbi:MAG TPA: hypothetical protein VJY62_21825 [Bacteroidia bacterium]|nr:hypothetical protein [Bacteroidia bacterium]